MASVSSAGSSSSQALSASCSSSPCRPRQSSLLAGERHEPLEVALIATHAKESVFEATALQEILLTVDDADRADQAAALADQLKAIFVKAQTQLQADMQAFRDLNADVSTTTSQFQAALTAEEWEQLNDVRKTALQSDLKLL